MIDEVIIDPLQELTEQAQQLIDSIPEYYIWHARAQTPFQALGIALDIYKRQRHSGSEYAIFDIPAVDSILIEQQFQDFNDCSHG